MAATITAISALVIAVIAALTPLILSRSTAKAKQQELKIAAEIRKEEKQQEAALKQQEKEEQWKRDDKVARDLLEAQKKTTEGTKEVARLVEEQTKVTSSQLDGICAQTTATHTYLNHETTERMKGERLDKLAILLLLEGISNPSEQHKIQMSKMRDRIKELDILLAEREEQQKKIDERLALDKKEAHA